MEHELIFQRLWNYALRLLGRRDYSETEMRKKIERKFSLLQKAGAFNESVDASTPGDEPDVMLLRASLTQRILTRLKELNLVNDEKFARNFLITRLELNQKGEYLLRMELKKNGIPREVFDAVWQKVAVPDEELAQRILKGKSRILGRLKPEKRKQKIMQLLASRGIKPSVIFELLEKV